MSGNAQQTTPANTRANGTGWEAALEQALGRVIEGDIDRELCEFVFEQAQLTGKVGEHIQALHNLEARAIETRKEALRIKRNAGMLWASLDMRERSCTVEG